MYDAVENRDDRKTLLIGIADAFTCSDVMLAGHKLRTVMIAAIIGHRGFDVVKVDALHGFIDMQLSRFTVTAHSSPVMKPKRQVTLLLDFGE